MVRKLDKPELSEHSGSLTCPKPSKKVSQGSCTSMCNFQCPNSPSIVCAGGSRVRMGQRATMS